MKQHINYSDFKSVDDNTFEKMAELWFREEYKDIECFSDKPKGYWLRQRKKDKNFMYEFTKYFTIGKMIEILDNKTLDWMIEPDYFRNEKGEKINCYRIETWIEKYYTRVFSCDNLNDALWEAIKEIL